MTFDLYVWKSPRDLDADRAEDLIGRWNDAGGDPARSPFEPSADVGWFNRELAKDEPGLETSSDAEPNPDTAPIWLSARSERPARVVGIRLARATSRDSLDTIFGLAAKYDLVVFDTRSRRVHLPLEALAAHAGATFWPAGAIQAAVAGGVGALIAVVAWLLGIPLISGLVALIGGFLVVMAAFTFVRAGRRALSSRRGRGESPPGR